MIKTEGKLLCRHCMCQEKTNDVYFIDILVDIQPIDVYVSIGDKTQFSCNFTGEHRVRREKVTWLKGNMTNFFFFIFILN
jgi:hypothetical protein